MADAAVEPVSAPGTVTNGPDAVAVAGSWPTGAKVFLILSIALLPIAIIAIFATLQVTRAANAETRARLRLATTESSRVLGIELVGDAAALKAAVTALAVDPADAPSCARAHGVFAQQYASGTRFVVYDAAGRVVCGQAFPTARAASRLLPVGASLAGGRGVTVGIVAPGGRASGAIFFPATFLSRLGRPTALGDDYGQALVAGGSRLALVTLDVHDSLERRETIRAPLGIGGLVLEMQARGAPISSPMVIAMLLPLVMWAAAAGTAWFVVDRLLIRPLRALRSDIAAYRPGTDLDPPIARMTSAQEIRDLGETFRAISRTVVLHEAGLADGLVRQTKLTREVHHRVKNNLQVIASLINLHSRGAKSSEATQAYSTIQRRVDALAVVHRNHFAEMEENRGLNLRNLLGELVANFRATAPEGTAIAIVADIDAVMVSQDTAAAAAFLVTEILELAMACDPAARLRVSIKPAQTPGRAVLRISSPALGDGDALQGALATRYARVMEGLSRQLRARLHHDPLVGAYEIEIAILGPD